MPACLPHPAAPADPPAARLDDRRANGAHVANGTGDRFGGLMCDGATRAARKHPLNYDTTALTKKFVSKCTKLLKNFATFKTRFARFSGPNFTGVTLPSPRARRRGDGEHGRQAHALLAPPGTNEAEPE